MSTNNTMPYEIYNELRKDREALAAAASRLMSQATHAAGRAAAVGALKRRAKWRAIEAKARQLAYRCLKLVSAMDELLLRSWVDREEGPMKTIRAPQKGKVTLRIVPGQKISRDELVGEITGDKVDCELRSRMEGYIDTVLVENGQDVEVDDALYVVARETQVLVAEPFEMRSHAGEVE